MKKNLTLFALGLMTSVGAWAQTKATVITDNASATDYRLTIDAFRALKGTGGHFAFHTTQRTDWSQFHHSDTGVNTLTADQLYTLLDGSDENSVWIANYAGETITSIGNGQPAVYTAEATTGVDFYIVDCGSTPHSNFGDKQFRLDNENGLHLRIHSNDFTDATGDWTRYVAYGPFYVARLEYQVDGVTASTEDIIVTAGNMNITSAPAGYAVVGTPSITITQDATFQIPVTLAANWAGLESVITEADSYPYGDGIGEYSNPDFGYAKVQASMVWTNHLNGLDAEKTLVDEAINGLRTEIDKLTINQPTAGKFYRFKHAGEFNERGTAKYYNGTTRTSTVGAENIFYLDESKHLIQYSTGLYCNGTSAPSIDASTVTYEFAAAYGMDSRCTRPEYTIHASNMTNYLCYWGHDDDPAMDKTGDNWASWYIEEVEALPVTLNANSGCASFYAPVAMTVTSGDAYIAVVKDASTITLSPVADNVIPAGSGVILKGTGTATLTLGGEVTETRDNALKGSEYTKIKPTDEGTIYVLVNNNGAPAFQMYSGANVNGFKAYLPIAGGSSNFRVVFDEGFTTGIEAIESKAQGEIFDLQGRRIQNAKNGLYIVNGRKVIF